MRPLGYRFSAPALAILAATFSSPMANAQATAVVDPATQFQTFEGWGTSLAWWAHVVGNWPESARSEIIDKTFDPVKGLGFNVARYNIGGENPLHLAPNKQFLTFRTAVPSYQPFRGQGNFGARGTGTPTRANAGCCNRPFARAPTTWRPSRTRRPSG
jgi:O-glycosyl hydrolase